MSETMAEELRLGVLGCGGFGLFALQHFLQVPGVRLAAVAGTRRAAARAAAARYGVEVDEEGVEALVRRDDVDLVYIATPPFLHHPQARAALLAGKHVLVEKPLALTLEQADELLDLAVRGGRLCVADFIQRYNPLFEAVRRLVAGRVLGDFLYGRFENCATDEGLGADHWFWDREKSGGIFVEHGVHFFDLFEGWLGPGRVVAAGARRRPETGAEEQVHCLVAHAGGFVAHYHGFHQPGRLESQELRLVFERGELHLHDWIPVGGRIRALVDEAGARALTDLFPEARLDVLETYAGDARRARGRGKPIDALQLCELRFGQGARKLVRYGECLRALMEDQLRWIRDPAHPRRVTEANGRDSLAAALAARALADAGEP